MLSKCAAAVRAGSSFASDRGSHDTNTENPAHTEPATRRAATATPVLDIVIPVYNEERGLAECVSRLREYLANDFPFRTQFTIADNASTDGTLQIAHLVANELDNVRVVHLDIKGRSRALRTAWLASNAREAHRSERICAESTG